MRSLSWIVFPCMIAALVHLWWARDETAFSWGYKYTATKNLKHTILVGVLSARHHHDQREVIRNTWLGYLSNHSELTNRVLVKFIIGKHGCGIPEEDREDPYSCTLLNLTEPVAGQDVALLTMPEFLVPSDVSAVCLDFKVLHPVIITQLGVFPSGPKLNFKGNVSVKLFPVNQEEAVVTAYFTAFSPGIYVDGIWYKAVEQFILPKGFEGHLVWESQDLEALMTVNVSKIHLNTGGGVLKLGSIEEGTLPHRSAQGFPGLAGGFTFSVHDVATLVELLQSRVSRQLLHVTRLKQEDQALQEESDIYGDITLVDIVDTYRTVPAKLLQFYKWAVKNAKFNLLLKTDDDCYINVDRVLMSIDHKSLTPSNLWWGNFRQNWAVDRVGKWQELEYSSPVYPAFACGSGYVVSRDLVEWLASNAEKLKVYQGEDVSMGIWMAAVGPQKYQDSAWLCEKKCYVDMLSSPQHTLEELYSLWQHKRDCGDPCGCY